MAPEAAIPTAGVKGKWSLPASQAKAGSPKTSAGVAGLGLHSRGTPFLPPPRALDNGSLVAAVPRTGEGRRMEPPTM